MEMVTAMGFCKFCGQEIMIDVPEGLQQDRIDELATAECSCFQAMKEREKRMQLESAEYEIRTIIQPKSAEAADILTEGIGLVQSGKVKEINVFTPDKWRFSIKRGKGGILVSAQTKHVEEAEVM